MEKNVLGVIKMIKKTRGTSEDSFIISHMRDLKTTAYLMATRIIIKKHAASILNSLQSDMLC